MVILKKFRPGHADYTYWKKYGIRDYRGGGRSSARETAMRVAAGAIARKIIKNKIKNKLITGALIQIGNHKINYNNEYNFIPNNFWSPDKQIIKDGKQNTYARKSGSSLGAIIEIRVKVCCWIRWTNLWKNRLRYCKALMSINAVKGVEMGNGFGSVYETGISNVDEMRIKKKTYIFSNNNGGVLGGITQDKNWLLDL